jgi:hypothetical protein
MDLTPIKILEDNQSAVVSTANIITVTNQEDYGYATEFLKNVKTVSKNIVDYFAEDKKKASELHKSIVQKEKDLLTPLTSAENIVKQKMATYADEQRRIERELQAKQEEARKIEADRLMAEAANAETNGDTLQAEINLSMAESLVNNNNFQGNTRQQGTREVKELKVFNESLVPCYVNGICIRPVDMVALKKLYSLTNQVPDGVSVETKTTIVIR